MRSTVGLAVVTLMFLACGSPGPTDVPTIRLGPLSTLLPLPDNLSGIPENEEFTAEVSPRSPRGELVLGVARTYTLGHCGLGSPIDVDGSLWDPVGAHNGVVGPLTEEQMGELINSTPTVVTLLDESTLEMSTLAGALLIFTRHEGPRRYFLCD